MALTKVTGQVIKNTTDVTVGVLTVTNTLAVGGTVSIGGTLTYEDVTNVDAVGLITARNGIVVGSGITLSKDGDIFATGITTISENLKVGTGVTISPDGDGFFTGVVTATSYAGDGSALTGISVDSTQIVTGNTSVQTVDTGSDGHVKATTEGSERLRIDSGGKFFFHGTSATGSNNTSALLPAGYTLNVHGTNSNDGISVVRYSGSYGAYGINIGRSRNDTFGTNTAVQDGDELGHVTFYGADGTNFDYAAQITGLCDGEVGTGGDATDMPGALSFRTTPEGSDSPTEKFRIESDGDFLLSNADAGTNYAFIRGWQSSTGDMIIGADQSATGTNGSNLIFRTRGSEKVRIEKHGTLKVSNNLSVTGIATVGSAVTISESGIEASGIGITVANINGSSTGSKNLIINGAMNVAQYDLSEGNGTKTTSSGHLCDRWKIQQGGIDENARMEHVDVGSSDTGPYEEGFRKSLKIQNGNQSSGAGAADFMELYQYIEGDQMLTSGWDYKNPNSKLTISMWVKSTIAQTFPGFVYTTSNGSSVHYMYDYVIGNGTSNLTANTWTKVKHTLPGNSNLVITAGTGYGLGFGIFPFQGTNYTTSRSASNAWQAWDSNNKVPDLTTTWYTTNNAQLYITGVQLEVGEEATPYKHKHITEEQMMCKRYYQVIAPSAADHMMFGFGRAEGNTARIGISVPVPMRAVPTVICSNNRAVKYDSTMTQSTTTPSVYNSGSVDLDSNIMTIDFGGHSSLTHNNVYIVTSDSGGSLQLSAEL